MKTENYVMVPFDSISLRTKFKKIMNINHFKPKAKSLTVPNMKWWKLKKERDIVRDSYFAPWKQQILTLSRFLLCAGTIPELNRAR